MAAQNWMCYDSDGNYVTTMYGEEENIKSICEKNGWTYVLRQDQPEEPTLTSYQQALIDEFNSMQSRIISFIQDHAWANERATFDLATKQYDAMIELYLVLADRIRYEGLENYVTIN